MTGSPSGATLRRPEENRLTPRLSPSRPTLLLAAVLALAPAPAGASDVKVETGVAALPQVHLANLALLGAMPLGNASLPLTTGNSLAGRTPLELQAAYAKAAGIQKIPELPAPAPGLAVAPAADLPSAELTPAKQRALAVAAAALRPIPDGHEWSDLARRFDGLGELAPEAGGVSERGPPKAVAPGLLAVADAPQPSVKKLDRWLGGAKPQGYAWAYLNMDRELTRELLDQISAPSQVRQAVESLYSPSDADVTLAAATLDRQPDWAARFLRKRAEMEGAMYEKFADLPSLVTAWRDRGADAAVLRAVLDDTFEAGGGYQVVLSARTWARLGPAQRAAAAAALHQAPLRRGGRLYLALAGADFAALAEKYAGGRDARPLERLLRAAAARGEKYLPLEKILPKRIRSRLGSFADCSGPNCVNAVMSEVDAYDDGTTLMARLKADYDRQPDGTELRPGDKLVYANMNKEFVHIAESVGDGWVFTKNGMGRHYPYLFQEKAVMEAVHFPTGEFRLIVFRPRKEPAR